MSALGQACGNVPNTIYVRTAAELTARLASVPAGTVICCAQGTYADTFVLPDGTRLILYGADLTAVSIASPGGGEVAYIEGIGTIGTSTAAVGAHVAVGANVAVTNQVGMIRRGRVWYLPTATAVATYCPAAGTVVPVLVGDQLVSVSNPDSNWSAMTADGAVRWIGDGMQSVIPGTTASVYRSLSATGAMIWRPLATRMTKVWLRTLHIGSRVASGGDATNYWIWNIWDTLGNVIATSSTQGDANGTQIHKIIALDDVCPMPVHNQAVSAVNDPAFGATKVLAPGDLGMGQSSLEYHPVLE